MWFYSRPEQPRSRKTARIKKQDNSNENDVDKSKIIAIFNNLTAKTPLTNYGETVLNACEMAKASSLYKCVRDSYAIAILETSGCKSNGCRKFNAVYSIHCTPKWQGKCAKISATDTVRVYHSITESIYDFARLYVRNKWESNNFARYNGQVKWYRDLEYLRGKFRV